MENKDYSIIEYEFKEESIKPKKLKKQNPLLWSIISLGCIVVFFLAICLYLLGLVFAAFSTSINIRAIIWLVLLVVLFVYAITLAIKTIVYYVKNKRPTSAYTIAIIDLVFSIYPLILLVDVFILLIGMLVGGKAITF